MEKEIRKERLRSFMTEITNSGNSTNTQYAIQPETISSLEAISHELFVEVTINQRFDLRLIENYIIMAYKCGRYDEKHKHTPKI